MKKTLIMLLLSVLISNLLAQAGYKIGDKATDFELKATDGKTYSLAKDFKNAKGYIVIFTCNHCPFSKMYEDRIIAIQKKYGSNGYPVVAINPNDPEVNPDDSFEKMVIRAKEKGFNFPYLFDQGQHIYPQYGATKTPHVYVLDKQRIVKYIGAIDDNAKDASQVEEKYLEMSIEALLEGKEIKTKETKAIGCSIKTKKK